MSTSKHDQGPCPVGRGLALVGDTWSMLIIRDAAAGATQFDQFRKSLGIAPNILAARLRALVENGVLDRQRYSERPPRDAYVLTEAGRDFLAVLQAFAAWGRRHNGAGMLSTMVDAETGQAVEPIVIDRVSGAEIGSRRLVLRPAGPLAGC